MGSLPGDGSGFFVVVYSAIEYWEWEQPELQEAKRYVDQFFSGNAGLQRSWQ